jgi:protein-tyrosine phosphatase
LTFSDYAEVTPGLFVGAHPEPEDPFDLGANVVVCLASGTSVGEVPRNGLLIHWPIKDGPVPDPETLRGIADLIVRCLGSGASVYLHCQAGMNRSVLVGALVLMHQGMTAEEAIERVRERRHGSLSDEYADWLRSEQAVHSTDQGFVSRQPR